MKPAAYIFLPRSEFFFTWGPVERGEVWPLPLSELLWTSRRIKSTRDKEMVVHLAITKVLAEKYLDAAGRAGAAPQGIAPLFMERWLRLARQHPEVQKADVVLADVRPDETEITLFRTGLPLFSRTVRLGPDMAGTEKVFIHEVERTIMYVKRSFEFSAACVWSLSAPADLYPMLPDVFTVKFESPPLSEINCSALDDEPEFYIPVGGRESRSVRLWKTQGKNLLSIGSILFLLLAGLLKSGTAPMSRAPDRVRGNVPQQNRGPDAADVFVDVARRVPQGTSLMNFKLDGGQRTVSLKGRSPDYGPISELVSALHREPRFKDVRAHKSHLIRVGERSVVEFSLEADLR